MLVSAAFLRHHKFLRHIFGRPRLMICILIGLVTFFAMPSTLHESTRVLTAWNVATWIYLVVAGVMMARSSEQMMRRRAALTDESRFVILTFACAAAAVSIVAIIIQLAEVKDMHGLLRALHLGLAATTIVSAWTFIHLVFAQHYAHEYFVERASEKLLPEDQRGGLCFPGSSRPDYSDFLYFSFVIGVAGQTADVDICSRPMRRVVLIHCVLSFFFNTTVLALTINIAAGLI